MADQTILKFGVTGLNCAGCAGRAERALAAVPGVVDATVNFATSKAHVTASGATVHDMSDALDAAGYPAHAQDIRLSLQGLNCASCVGRVEDALLKQPEILSATVNLATKSATLRALGDETTAQRMARVVTDAGYPASLDQIHSQTSATDERTQARNIFLLAAALTLPVFVLEMGGHVFPAFHHWVHQTIGQTQSWLIQFVLTSIVMLWPGQQFFRIGVPALLRGAPEMNSLVALGTSAAWVYSTVALFLPTLLPQENRVVYYEAAAVIITLILLGRWLEARARGQTGAAIRALAKLRPETAQIIEQDQTRDIPIDAISVGDTLRARAGDRIAVDGIVTRGETHIDESMITGEPMPVAKSIGDPIVAGTVNTNGNIEYSATKVGADTMLARIITLVEDAQATKLPIQQLADRVVRVFVPAVIGVSIVTILAWLIFSVSADMTLALVAGVSVLIIACPCAMGLATPTSIMVGTGRAAQLGVLFRKGDALQRLSEIRVVAFDKTGTLTRGEPQVVQSDGSTSALRLAAALEAHSSHPLAKAISGAYTVDDSAVTDVQTMPGCGVTGQVAGHAVTVGNASMMQMHGINAADLDQFGSLTEADHTPVYIAIDGHLKARVAISDPLKPGAIDLVHNLHQMGLRTVLITGDTKDTAHAIARRIGIDDVRAGVLPDGKSEAVRSLQDNHGPIAFVGDGINDAPALATADVGIALGTGTDVAIESADVILASPNLSAVIDAIRIARATLRNIRQNLGWAFGYNILLIPVAAGLFYPLTGWLLSPMLAAGAMALSSVFVVSNALRLKALEPTK